MCRSGSRQSLISIHALREEGDFAERHKDYYTVSISIHALREEGDDLLPHEPFRQRLFLSTPSARRATLEWMI